jgi:hypothetical protein
MNDDPRLLRDAPYPWVPFFKRAEALATAAFQTIPFVGDGVAEFFNSVVVPRCTPPRDRALGLIRRGVKGIEGRLACALLRLMPLPRPTSNVQRPTSSPAWPSSKG